MNILNEWKVKLLLDGKSKKTYTSYEFDVNMFFKWMNKEVTLENLKQVKLQDVNGFMFYLMDERNNNEATRARRTKSLKSLYNTLQELELLTKEENICESFKSPKIQQKEMVYLSEEEAINLISDVKGSNQLRNTAIIYLFLTTGLRLSELININVEDIRGNAIVVLGKGNKERTVWLNDDTIIAINNWLNIRQKVETNALFVSERNNRMSVNAMQHMIKSNLKNIDREDCSTHKLRHTCATLMLIGGANVKTVQKALGHTDIKTTSRYLHAVDKDVENASKSIKLSAKIKI